QVVTNVTHDSDANPAQVVEAQRYLLKAAREHFDVIVLDTAPVLSTNDALDVAPLADCVLLVARAERTTRDAAQLATEALGRIRAETVGVVLVGAQPLPNRYFYESDARGATDAPTRVVQHVDGDDAPAWIEEELAGL